MTAAQLSIRRRLHLMMAAAVAVAPAIRIPARPAATECRNILNNGGNDDER